MHAIQLTFKSEVDRHDLGQIFAYLVEKQIEYQFYLSGITIMAKNPNVAMAIKLRFSQCFVADQDDPNKKLTCRN